MATVVGHTPNGREIRQRADGKYEVQPPGDNWWAVGDTQEEALKKAGWIEPHDVIELRCRLLNINDAIDKFTECCELVSINEINEDRIPDSIPSPWRETAQGLSRCRQEIENLLDRRLSGL